MKQSKVMLALELAYLAYMCAILWMLFPQWRGPIVGAVRMVRYRWALGWAQLKLAGAPGWLQEAAVVRGKLPHIDRPFPRPLNLPD